MSYIFSIFLGFVQGVAEFLPISSSGHLAIFQNLFGMKNVEDSHMFFDVLLHFGTLIAVFAVYYKDIFEMLGEFFALIRGMFKPHASVHSRKNSKNIPPARRLLFLLIIATLPLISVIFFKDFVESLMRNTMFIAFALFVTGALLFISDHMPKGRKNETTAKWTDVLFVGVLQVIAVIPGLSRSGTTIAAGLFRGFDRKFAIRFSFLMSIPAVLGANILSFKDAYETGIDNSLIPIYIAGVISAAIFGYISIRLVKYISDRNKFGYFAYYCWGIALATIIFVLVSK